MISENILQALRVVYDRLNDRNVCWMLVGSLSLAVQGVDVVPHDIDVLTDKPGVFLIGGLLKDYAKKPVEYKQTVEARSYLGEFCIYGIEIEVMAEYQEKVNGQWITLSSRLESPILLKMDAMLLPVSLLMAQLESYESSTREKDRGKAEKIRKLLDNLRGN